jgi:hypothetical protein
VFNFDFSQVVPLTQLVYVVNNVCGSSLLEKSNNFQARVMMNWKLEKHQECIC